MTLEVDIEDKVVKWAQKHRFLTPKIKFVETGYPDRMFVSPYGHTIFIEFKKPGEEPTPIQYYRLEELTKRGVPATWCDNVHEAIGILKSALETAVGSPSVSDPSDKGSIVAGVSRALSRSGAGEDINGVGGVQSSKEEVTGEEDVDSGPAPPSPQGVAGRDKEVVRLLRPHIYHPTWGREGPKS